MDTDGKLESRIRSLAKRRGYSVHKSREWKYVPHSNNYGNYMLVENNCVVIGDRYDVTLEEIEDFLLNSQEGRAA